MHIKKNNKGIAKTIKRTREHYHSEAAIIKAANIIIMRSIWDAMNLGTMKDLYEELEISRTTATSIIRGDMFAGKEWEHEKVAKKMKMNPDIFSGKRLLLIQGETILYIQENFEKLLAEQGVKNKVPYLYEKDELITEELLWGAILDSYEYKKDNDWNKGKQHLIHEIARQTKDEDFNDVQVWKFWNYMRRKYQKN